jgi:hypothetical protein
VDKREHLFTSGMSGWAWRDSDNGRTTSTEWTADLEDALRAAGVPCQIERLAVSYQIAEAADLVRHLGCRTGARVVKTLIRVGRCDAHHDRYDTVMQHGPTVQCGGDTDRSHVSAVRSSLWRASEPTRSTCRQSITSSSVTRTGTTRSRSGLMGTTSSVPSCQQTTAPTAEILRKCSTASRLRSLRSPLRGLDPASALPTLGNCRSGGKSRSTGSHAMHHRTTAATHHVTIGRHARIYLAYLTTAPADLDAPATVTLQASTFADVRGFAADHVTIHKHRAQMPARLILIDAMELGVATRQVPRSSARAPGRGSRAGQTQHLATLALAATAGVTNEPRGCMTALTHLDRPALAESSSL